MGIPAVLKFIKDKYPDVIECHALENFRNTQVSFDVATHMRKYMYAYGKEGFLKGFVSLICLFKRNGIHAIPIFDGKAPQEKDAEKNMRASAKKKLRDDIENLKQEITEDMDELKFNDLQEKIYKKEKCDLQITNEDISKLKKLFSAFGIPFYDAPEEAETLACYLVNTGICSAVISTDSDCLAYNVPYAILGLDIKTNTCTVIENDKLLNALGFNKEQLTLFGILSGCDYNSSTKLKGFGAVSVFNLIKKYGDYDRIKESLFGGRLTKDDDPEKIFVVKRSLEIFNTKYTDFKRVSWWDSRVTHSEIQNKCAELCLFPILVDWGEEKKIYSRR